VELQDDVVRLRITKGYRVKEVQDDGKAEDSSIRGPNYPF
jgi:hypothetical protein